MHKPSWFRADEVAVSFAPTVGINKDGEELFKIDARTGQRTDVINDALREDVESLLQGETGDTAEWVPLDSVKESGVSVPVYYDTRTTLAYEEALTNNWPSYSSASLGDLVDDHQLEIHGGHGSPSADVRTGTVPYIKVSDLRAGQVNINPTNRVSEVTARKYWHGSDSGLSAFDLITPARTSKNIGDIAVLMPGQERVVLTKEMLVMRPGPKANFDSFYLLWAMSLTVVREQWRRIIFMQTNREDTGTRYREIEIPMAPSQEERDRVSEPFRTFYEGTAGLRESFLSFLDAARQHHVFLASSEAIDESSDEDIEAAKSD